MAEVVFVIDEVGWNHEFRSWDGVVGKHMLKVMLKEQTLSMASAPGPTKPPRNRTMINYSTGQLEAEIIVKMDKWGGELEGQVIALSPHANIVHEGSRDHDIFPKQPGGLLRFHWAKVGQNVALPFVHHPGTAAIPFLVENLAEAMR